LAFLSPHTTGHMRVLFFSSLTRACSLSPVNRAFGAESK
jgi:hypothetical protein